MHGTTIKLLFLVYLNLKMIEYNKFQVTVLEDYKFVIKWTCDIVGQKPPGHKISTLVNNI
jgi:hypothetical protein